MTRRHLVPFVLDGRATARPPVGVWLQARDRLIG